MCKPEEQKLIPLLLYELVKIKLEKYCFIKLLKINCISEF